MPKGSSIINTSSVNSDDPLQACWPMQRPKVRLPTSLLAWLNYSEKGNPSEQRGTGAYLDASDSLHHARRSGQELRFENTVGPSWATGGSRPDLRIAGLRRGQLHQWFTLRSYWRQTDPLENCWEKHAVRTHPVRHPAAITPTQRADASVIAARGMQRQAGPDPSGSMRCWRYPVPANGPGHTPGPVRATTAKQRWYPRQSAAP